MLHSRDLFEKNPPAGFDGQFHWDYLIPPLQKATGRNIQPMDQDAGIEIGGHHLVFETKNVGVPVPRGQVRALLQLWAKGYHTIVFLWGKKEPHIAKIYYAGGEKKGPMRNITKEYLVEVTYRWAVWANRNPCPFQYVGSLDVSPPA